MHHGFQWCYSSNEKCSQEVIFHYWDGCLSDQAHVDQTYPDVVRIHVETVPWLPTSEGAIQRVLFSAGKQHDSLKKETMDKTLENTLKVVINTKLPTCDDEGVFTDVDDTHTGNTSSLRCHELGRRKGVQEVVVYTKFRLWYGDCFFDRAGVTERRESANCNTQVAQAK